MHRVKFHFSSCEKFLARVQQRWWLKLIIFNARLSFTFLYKIHFRINFAISRGVHNISSRPSSGVEKGKRGAWIFFSASFVYPADEQLPALCSVCSIIFIPLRYNNQWRPHIINLLHTVSTDTRTCLVAFDLFGELILVDLFSSVSSGIAVLIFQIT